MSRTSTLGLALALIACDPKTSTPAGDVPRGSAAACLDAGGAVARTGEETVPYDISGTIVSDEAGELAGDIHPCYGSSRVLTISGGDGVTWQLGYGMADAEGVDITPALDVEAGATIYLHFVSVRSFGDASGFVLQDTTSVIGAMEVGTWGTTLTDTDFPGLSVEVGDIADFGANECGEIEGYALNFVGDATRALTPVEDKLITVGGNAFTAYALSAWEYSTVECTDTAGETEWAVFR